MDPTVDELYRQMVVAHRSFWTVAYPLYMRRVLAKRDVRALVDRGLRETRGRYRAMLRMFNMPDEDYKRFMSFLYKQECHLPFRKYREHR